MPASLSSNSEEMISAKEILKSAFGFDQFRLHQEEIIQTVLSGKDTFVLMPTGGGKSVCYQIPALILPGVTLVISPLISLMKDQVDGLRAHGIAAVYINSSLNETEAQQTIQRCKNGEVKIIYMSPEKALSSSTFISQLPVSLIAIDEAHCISGWGHDFRPEYKQLSQLRTIHPQATVMALTATADRLTQKDILDYLGLRNPEIFVSTFDRPNLSLLVSFGLKKKDKINDILNILQRYKGQSGIIYCTSKKTTEALAGELKHLGYSALHYHAGLSKEEREKTQEQFINDEVQVICATIAFGMGIDKSNVRFVLHYNLPKSIENYYQEIGRGGRDGAPCETKLYYSFADVILLKEFASSSGLPEVNSMKLQRMQEYAEARICRRKILLNYFGENLRENCNNCDVCLDPPIHIDGTKYAQMALSAITRAMHIQQTMTIPQLILCLRGSMQQEIVQKNLHTIKTHGVGKEISFSDWSAYIMQMIQLGALEVLYEQHNILRITPFGGMILSGTFPLDLITPVYHSSPTASEKVSHKESLIEGDLFEQLRSYRKKIATLENVAPYLIFHDTALHEMVEKLPMSKEEMLNISGMSERKFERYGNEFLDLIIKTAPPTYQPAKPVSSILQGEVIRKFSAELEALNVSVNGTVMAKLLLGSTESKFKEIGKGVSFYGLLHGKFKVKELYDMLQEFLEPLKKEKEEQNDKRLIEASNKLLSRAESSELSQAKWNDFAAQANALFVRFETAEEKKSEDGKRRWGKRWNEEETALLKELTYHTSNIQEICSILERSERSVRFALLTLGEE